jgi:hypothetical protein
MTLSAGDLYYNGFYFPPAISATVRQRPVMDSTRRFAKYQTFSLLVECLLYAGCDDNTANPGSRNDPVTGTTYQSKFPATSSLNPPTTIPPTTDGPTTPGTPPGYGETGIAAIRKILSEPGGPLMYKDKGMGVDFFFRGNYSQLPLTTPGGYVDTIYGPHPKLLVWEQIAGNKCTRLIWECEVTFADCDLSESGRKFALAAEFSYEVNWAISSCGLTTRTISGQVEIPIQRIGPYPQYNADLSRERVKFVVPNGFKRNQNWTLSNDKRFLRFTLTDTEIDSDEPYRAGMCEMDVRETVSNRAPLVKSNVWTVNISGRIRVAAGYHKWLAWFAFAEILRARMGPVRSTRAGITGNQTESGGFVTGLRLSEEIYGRSLEFSVTYWFKALLKDLREAAGLWVPIDHNNWTTYNDVMTRVSANKAGDVTGIGPFSHRANAQLMHNTADDLIISMCGENNIEFGPLDRADRKPKKPNYDTMPTANGPGEKEGVYFDLKANANLHEDTGTVSAQSLGGGAVKNIAVGPDTDGTGITEQSPGVPDPNLKIETMQRHASNFKVEFYGHAMRFDKPVPRITLVQYGKQLATPIGKLHFEQQEIVTLDGRVLHLARWYGNYQLLGVPKEALISSPKTSDFV